jgi:hypothetical protein
VRELAERIGGAVLQAQFSTQITTGEGPNRMSTNEVTLSIDDRVAVVEMHRPPMNFFDRDLLAVIADAGEEAQSDGARAMVLCSEGRHFCAGLNLSDGPGPRSSCP